jgi:hypothetical protein
MGQIFMKFGNGYFWNYVKQILISLRSDKNNTYFTGGYMYIYDNLTLNSS